METLAIKLTGWLGAIFPAALGSALAIYMDKANKLTKLEIVCTWVFGANIAYILGGAAIEYWSIVPNSLIACSIQFTVGLMGMATLAQIMLQLPLIVSALRKKFIGE